MVMANVAWFNVNAALVLSEAEEVGLVVV